MLPIAHARSSFRMIDRFLSWGDHINMKNGKIKGSCQPPLQLTSDKEILWDISHVHIPCAYAPEQHLSGIKNNIPHIPASDTEISKMLSKVIIEPANPCSGEIVSSIFTRPKKRWHLSHHT